MVCQRKITPTDRENEKEKERGEKIRHALLWIRRSKRRSSKRFGCAEHMFLGMTSYCYGVVQRIRPPEVELDISYNTV